MRILTTLCSAVLVFACDRTRSAPEPATDDVEQCFGKRVTLVGDIEAILGPRAFVLSGEDLWLDADRILVLTRSPTRFTHTPSPGDEDVIATGSLRRATVAELERDLGWDFAPDIEVQVARQPVFVADSLVHVGAYSRWSDDPVKSAVGLLSLVTTNNAETLAGQRVHFEGALVQRVMANAVWVGPSPQSTVLVVPVGSTMLTGIESGALVTVSGTVRSRAGQPRVYGDRDPTAAQIYVEATQLQSHPRPST